jgi:DNA-binding response OmpR family regulator
MNKLRIFVVDDDRDFAESLADVLRLDGHEVDTAYTGEEAVTKYPRQHYDLTFMDVKLPGRNGVESFLEIRRLNPHAQVFMMTGYSVENLLDEAVAGGARGVLHKPLDLQHLLELVAAIKPGGILIAADDPDFVESVRELLEQRHYNVYVARNGREALERVLADGIDVLILDLKLPILSGLEVYLELKRTNHCVPTIIVTAYAREETETLDTLRSLSVTGVLIKPFDPEELLAAVARMTAQQAGESGEG